MKKRAFHKFIQINKCIHFSLPQKILKQICVFLSSANRSHLRVTKNITLRKHCGNHCPPLHPPTTKITPRARQDSPWTLQGLQGTFCVFSASRLFPKDPWDLLRYFDIYICLGLVRGAAPCSSSVAATAAASLLGGWR